MKIIVSACLAEQVFLFAMQVFVYKNELTLGLEYEEEVICHF